MALDMNISRVSNLGSLQAKISNISTTTLSAEGASYPVNFRLSYISEEDGEGKER